MFCCSCIAADLCQQDKVDLYVLSPLNTLQCVSSVKEKVQALKPNVDRNIEITR